MTQIDITKARAGTFVVALDNAEPGDEIVYHVGQHAGGKHKKDARVTADRGQCLLYQRRVGSLFAYIARKPAK